MQPIDLDAFPNTSGWQVKHDGTTNMYVIQADKGHMLRGCFTSRRMAEKHLFEYLTKIAKKSNKKKDD